MLEILRKFFRFCDERERREFYRSILLGVAAALFSALKIPAIGVILQAILAGEITAGAILLSLGIMLASVVGSSLLKYRATALQTDAGYRTTANKRVQIAEHLRYLPMGYFNAEQPRARSPPSPPTPWITSPACPPAWSCSSPRAFSPRQSWRWR